jgi:XTP/dITP diphosphohydrolase
MRRKDNTMTATLQRIVLATTNAGKIRELAEPLRAFGAEVLGLADFPAVGEIEENGQTFEENALIKARAVAAATGLVSVADDSGLEVDALGGAPGVHSARYSNDWQSLPGESRDARNMRKLLHELADVPDAKRGCRFVCCMAAVRPDGREMTVRGVWEGRLLHEPRGSNGFGYDPVFWISSLGKSAAELTREEKTARSHRGNALRALLARWEDIAR